MLWRRSNGISTTRWPFCSPAIISGALSLSIRVRIQPGGVTRIDRAMATSRKSTKRSSGSSCSHPRMAGRRTSPSMVNSADSLGLKISTLPRGSTSGT